jgi:hypothetical protein
MASKYYADVSRMHLRDNINDTEGSTNIAKVVAYLALIGAIIALVLSYAAWSKSNDTYSKYQEHLTSSEPNPL